MSDEAIPIVRLPGGAPVVSDAPELRGPAVEVRAPAVAFQLEAPDNPVLVLQVCDDVEVVAASVEVAGASHTANLANRTQVSGGLGRIELGAPRPISKIDFTPAGSPSELSVQLGGTWFTPQAPGVNFTTYRSGTPFPELVVEKALLSNVATITGVESTSFPANVTLRLTDAGVPFFFSRGELRSPAVRVPDFGAQVALTLAIAAPVDGVHAIDLVAHSDAFGMITARNARIVYRYPVNTLDGLSFEQRTVSIPAGGTAGLELVLPGGLALPDDQPPVSAVTIGLIGIAFGPAVLTTTGRRGAVVSPGFQVAQAIDVTETVPVSALFLLLSRRTPQATVTVELRRDADGEPRGTILASAPLDASGLPEGAFDWVTVALDPPVPVEPGIRFWIVLRSDAGEVEWRGDEPRDGLPTALFSSDKGNTWQAHPMSAALTFQRSPSGPAPLAITAEVGGQTETIPLDPSSLPRILDAGSALVRGINAALTAAAAAPGGALPQRLQILLRAQPPTPLQVTFTQADVTFTQVLTSLAPP